MSNAPSLTWVDKYFTDAGTQLANTGTGTLNDIPSTDASAIRFSGVEPTVTGIAGGAGARRIALLAAGGPLILANENAGSVAGNRIITGTGGDITVSEGAGAQLVYDKSSGRWRLASGGGGGGSGSGSNLGAALGVFKDVNAGVLRHRTIRVAGNLSGEEDPSGFAGELHIRPSPPGHYNVMDYEDGIVLDDQSPEARAANQAAVEAAIADMGPAIGSGANSYAGGVLYFPPGIYYFADTLTITRSIELRGHTASNGMFWAQTALCFPKGKTGIRLEYVTDSDDGGRADGSVVKNLALCSGPWSDGSASGAYTRWDISTPYVVGDIVIPAQWSKWGYSFECVTAGTSGTDDSFFPGKSMQDGLATRRIDQSVTAATNTTPIAITTPFSHGLTTGDMVVIAGALGNTAANGNWTVTVTGATTYTLDTSVGNGAYTADSATFGHIFDDNGVIWRLRHAHGIDIRATSCIVEDVYIRSFAGNGINITAAVPDYGGANLFNITRPTIDVVGGHGICVDGGDVNVSKIDSPSITDAGGFGMMCNPALGIYIVNSHVRDPRGGFAYWFDRCVADAIYAEGGAGPIYRGTYAEVRSCTPGDGSLDGYADSYRGPAWTAGDTVAQYAVRLPTVLNGYYYVATTAGTTGGTEPVWKTRSGSQQTDGSVVWTRWGIYGDPTDADDVAWGYQSGPAGALTAPSNGKNVIFSPSGSSGDRVETIMAPYGGYVVQKHNSRADATYGCGMAEQWNPTDHVWEWVVPEHGYPFMQIGMYATIMRPSLPGFFQGIALGNAGFTGSNTYPRMSATSEIPSVSTSQKGDFAFNATPSTGDPIGWRCTTAGSPGTWEAVYAQAGTGSLVTTDATPTYVTLATLGVGDSKEIDVLVRIAKSDGSVRQSFKLSGLFYGAGGPTATLDGGSLTDASPRGTGAAVASLDISGGDIRLKIVGIAATTLATTYDASAI